MKQALQIAIDYMNDRLEDHDCKYQRHPATEAERINILADIETVKEALAKQEGQSNFCPQCEALSRELKAAKQEQGEQKIKTGYSGWSQVIEMLTPEAKQEQGKPVAWGVIASNTGRLCQVELDFAEVEDLSPKWVMPLYTTPQQRTWVELTDREKSNLWLESRAAIPRFHTYATLVEAKLKERNT